jgi:hypothetical protein
VALGSTQPLTEIGTRNFNCITVHFYSSIIKHQQMHLRIIKKFNIFLGTLLHVSAPQCHPQGALSYWLKLIIT